MNKRICKRCKCSHYEQDKADKRMRTCRLLSIECTSYLTDSGGIFTNEDIRALRIKRQKTSLPKACPYILEHTVSEND